MAEIDGGRVAARQLRASGIDTVFGVVAGPMIEVLSGAQAEGLRVVGCRHEENAAFMASAWGYVNRKPGVVVVGSGPGMTNAVTPMHVATAGAMPLVVLGGSVRDAHRGFGGFQEADQMAFAAPGCKWTQRIDSTERIPELLHLALGKSISGRPGAVYLDFPAQIVSHKLPEESVALRRVAPAMARPHADPAAIERVADLLSRAERPLVLVGKGAAWADAGDALTRLVDLGLPYVASPMARGVIPDDHPRFANAARSTALREADAILMVGGRFNWIFAMGRSPQYRSGVRIAQIDVVAEEMYSAAEVDIGIVADAAVAVQQLANALEGRSLACAKSGWLEQLRATCEANEVELRQVTESAEIPIHPYRLVREVRDVLPRDATLSFDGEVIMGVARVLLPGYRARSILNAGTTGCIGTGLPYAIGAKLARPESASVAVLGDYAFGAAMMDVETAARIGANVVLVVANNEGIAGHMLQDFLFPAGAPPIARMLPARYEKLSEMVDGHSEYVERPEELRPALERALAADRVSIVHVRMDPKAARVKGSYFLG